MTKNRERIPIIILNNYFKLIYRSTIFLFAAVIYIVNLVRESDNPFGNAEGSPCILAVIWLVFVVDMLTRLFPSRIESMGCQKQFKKNFQPILNDKGEIEKPALLSGKRVIQIAAGWIALNAVFWVLYWLGIIDEGILILLALAFSVCDIICILFFCPFQTLWMKNRCCTSCRIYNWDHLMMFTPFLVIPSWYTWTLLALAAIIVLRWELGVAIHPERFALNTNHCLNCGDCKEQLCRYKVQLRRFWEKEKANLHLPEIHDPFHKNNA